MARATWTGAVEFGMVHIPIKLYSTVGKGIALVQVDSKSNQRVKHLRVNEEGAEVAWDDIISGYEAGDTLYTFTKEELEAVIPEKDKLLRIEQFIDPADIDPILYQGSYYIAPDRKADTPYALLVDALSATKKVAVGRYTMRTKQHLCVISVRDGRLLLSQLAFPEYLSTPPEGELKGEPAADVRKVAAKLVREMSSKFDPEDYRDDHQMALAELIEAKVSGKPTPTVSGLMDELQASVKSRKTRKAGR